MTTTNYQLNGFYRLVFLPSPTNKVKRPDNFVATFVRTERDNDVDLLVFSAHMDGQEVFIDASFIGHSNNGWHIEPFSYPE